MVGGAQAHARARPHTLNSVPARHFIGPVRRPCPPDGGPGQDGGPTGDEYRGVETSPGQAWPVPRARGGTAPRGTSRGAAPGSDLADLLAQVARGDQAAFEAVYDRVAAPVFGTVRSVLRDPSL